MSQFNSKINNLDEDTVRSFGDEWVRFDQNNLPNAEAIKIFNEYFSIFPWDKISKDSIGFDMGCGSGRWAKFIAPRVGHLHCIDPSSAIDVAKRTLSTFDNVTFHAASLDNAELLKNSHDFGYSLGVLHHVPDTARAIQSCAELLKPGAPFLVYLYYAFDNRSLLYKIIWRFSDLLRCMISRLPSSLKHVVTDLLALLVYYPLARLALLASYFGVNLNFIPLSYYKHHSFYTMRTDSRDRFGTPLEQRFTRIQITSMLNAAGLRNVSFSDQAPYWCAISFKQ
jgi:SAM-dependent methyltransferase